LLSVIRNLFGTPKQAHPFAFSRPLVLLQSDDWGRVGVRDRDGFELLRKSGLRLGEHPYDLYTLETAEDVHALADLLRKHRDSAGRSACLVMNFCTANLDFRSMRDQGFHQLHFLPLADGVPGHWSRPGLLDAYRQGKDEGLFLPSLHGTSHCSAQALLNAIAGGGERTQMLHRLWEAETPYIYWRMPWVGFEYWNPHKPHAGFLALEQQCQLVNQASENFRKLFGERPRSACAPGYRCNRDTFQAWAQSGIHVIATGTGDGLRFPHFEAAGLLRVYRTIDFEPTQRSLEIDKYLEIAAACFARGIPLTVSIHSINFHSTLKDFRSPTLAALDQLLSALEKRYPELLYIHNEDLYSIISTGAFRSRGTEVKVTVTRVRSAEAGAN
jgi:hypothetical protein